MKKLLLSLLFALVALTGLQAQTIWNGTADTSWYDETSTEFEISTAEQLAGLAELVNNGKNFSNKTVRLTADIVLNDTSDWENWENSAPNNTWTPIGLVWGMEFFGTFDGQGHTVSGIYNNSENYYQGLFGYNNGTIKNVGVTESYIKGDYNVGGVCGSNYGTISGCYNAGTVSGNEYVGGVCGYNSYGTISNCYNSGTVSGNSYIGGVCGYNSYGTISNCYNTGTVSGTGESTRVGGVCGQIYNGTITNCYYLTNTAEGGINGSTESGQAEAKTAEQFASGEVCWLLNGNSDQNPVWFQTLDTDDYPVLNDAHATIYAIGNCPNSTTTYNNNESNVGDHTDNDNDGRCDFCGKIMISEPAQKEGVYQISNRAELYWFAGLVNGTLSGVEQNIYANAALKADIIINENVLDAEGNLTESTDNLLVWSPIGNWYSSIFSGTFDGQGHTVSGIYYNSENIVCQGLFGHNEGTIKNVGVTESYIKGDYTVGGVCGDNYGTISNCYNAGTVSGTDEYSYAGGVCGFNDGSIFNCYNSGTVSGTGESIRVGGVCGFNDGSISNCYNTGTVSGTGESIRVGGVCGDNYGTISNCYNSGNVSGNDYNVGGVCGSNYEGTISDCSNSGNVSGSDRVGGVCGYNIRGTISNCYNSGTVSGNYNVGGVCGLNDGSISNCYNTGTVSGNYNVGGVCGLNVGSISNCHNSGEVSGNDYVGGVCGRKTGTISNCYYLEGTADGGIDGSDVSGQAEVKTAKQFASGEVCWLLNEKQSDGAWGQKLGTDPCPVLGGPAVFKDGETYYNEEGSAIVETNSEQASFVIVPENLTINIYGSDGEATVYNLAGNIVYKGSERIIPVTTAGMYLVRIGNEVQKTIVR